MLIPLILGVPYEGHCFPAIILQPNDKNYDTKNFSTVLL